jgi:hypothetical protein
MDDLEKARDAGRRWAAEHPLTEDQKQRLWALLEPAEQAS